MMNQMKVSLSTIQKAVRQIAEQFHPGKVFLFGSYAYGTPTGDSDVDLLVAMETSLRGLDQAVKIREVIDFSFPLDLLVRTPKQMKERLAMGDPFIYDIVNKGKLLYEAA